jgi:hypothetical protein
MWLIESSGKRQEIKLTGGALMNLLKFLTKNQDLLQPLLGSRKVQQHTGIEPADAEAQARQDWSNDE